MNENEGHTGARHTTINYGKAKESKPYLDGKEHVDLAQDPVRYSLAMMGKHVPQWNRDILRSEAFSANGTHGSPAGGFSLNLAPVEPNWPDTGAYSEWRR